MSESKRRALIIATGQYADPKLRQLRAPAADAERLTAVLANPSIGDFDVQVAVDEDEGTLTRRIARFFNEAGRSDVLLLHISCHGVTDQRNRLYLTASDTEMDLLDATAVSAAWLNEQMAHCRSRHMLLMLDCCFSGKFPFNATARAGTDVPVQDWLQGRGRAVLTASTATEYAYEGDELTGSGHESYFTSAVIEGLETGDADLDNDGWVSVGDLYDFVFDRVSERSPHQTPGEQRALEGPLIVAKSPREKRSVADESRSFSHRGRIVALAFSADGTRLASADRRYARIWHVDTGEEIARVVLNRRTVPMLYALAHGPVGLAFSSDGRNLFAASADGSVETWDARTGTQTSEPLRASQMMPPVAIDFSEHGARVAVARLGRVAYVFDVLNQQEICQVAHQTMPRPVSAMALARDAALLAIATFGGRVQVWKTQPAEELTRVRHGASVRDVALGPTGECLATAGVDGTVRLWDLADGHETAVLSHNAGVRTLVFSPDGAHLATASADMTARVWEVASANQLRLLTHDVPVRRLAFDPSGRQLATAGEGGKVRVWGI